LTIQQLETTVLVDTRHNLVLDVHRTTTPKHDPQIAPHPAARNTDRIAILVGDKGYDDQALRGQCRAAGIRLVVRHRGFTALDKAWSARREDVVDGQRARSKTVNSTIKRRFGSRVRSRIGSVQFREVTVKAIVHDVERASPVLIASSRRGSQQGRCRQTTSGRIRCRDERGRCNEVRTTVLADGVRMLELRRFLVASSFWARARYCLSVLPSCCSKYPVNVQRLDGLDPQPASPRRPGS